MSDHDFDNDFIDEQPNPRWSESMDEIMRSLREETIWEGGETVRSPGIPTLTSDRPTKPMRRPMVTSHMGDV